MNFVSIRSSYLIAGDSNVSPEILSYFMVHYDDRVRARVAANPALSRAQLFELMNDDCEEVRMAVAENPSTPAALLELLAEDDNPDVRYAIAENANMPLHILSLLAQDENPYVSERALTTLEKVWCQVEYVVAAA